jgi:hypothetical protein
MCLNWRREGFARGVGMERSDEGEVRGRLTGAIYDIEIDRPAKLNGFTPKMLRDLASAYTAFEHEAEARVAVRVWTFPRSVRCWRAASRSSRQTRSTPSISGRRDAPSRWSSPSRASPSPWESN